VERIDAEILRLLCGGLGPMRQTLGDNERAVLTAIRYHRGLANPINIRAIQLTTQLSDRQIKEAVRGLRLTFRLPIASYKHASLGGYYLWMTDEDLAPWLNDVAGQITSEVQVFRAATSEAAALTLAKQLWPEVTR
jgi:hypothetical protein